MITAEAATWPAPDVAARAPSTQVLSVRPRPTAEEVAAITIAIELLWPKPAAPATASASRAGAWRFSGRWWTRPVPARRSRPWY